MIKLYKKHRLTFSYADDVKVLVIDIINVLKDYFGYIDCSRIHVIRSRNSKSRAIARIYGLSRIWIFALGLSPQYVIEVISENFDDLGFEEKIYVLIHELLHIPKSFSGSLRSHKDYISSSIVRKLAKIYLSRKYNT